MGGERERRIRSCIVSNPSFLAPSFLVTRLRGMDRARSVKMLRDTLPGFPFLRSLSVGVSFFVSLYHAFGQTGGRTKRIPRIGLVNNSELPAAYSV